MNFREQIEQIKIEMMYGHLTYDEAKAKAQPIIDEMNKKAREVAKRWNKKHYNFTFPALMR